MKKILISVLLALGSIGSYAQEAQPNIQKIELPMSCLKAADAASFLQKHKEVVFFVGQDELHSVKNLTLSVFRNGETGSYTAALTSIENNLICIISAGSKSKFLFNL